MSIRGFVGLLFLLSLTDVFSQSVAPYSFMENNGQWEDGVRYKSEISNGSLILSDHGLLFGLVNEQQQQEVYDHYRGHSHHRKSDSRNSKVIQEDLPLTVQKHNVFLEFVNSLNPRIKSSKGIITKANFFLGQDTSKWARNVGVFNKVVYEGVYEGIDWQIESKENHFKHEFIVSPGSNPNDIVLQYHGADSVYVVFNQLYVKTSVVDIIEHKPVAFQITKKGKEYIPCEFKVEKGQVRFNLGKYNKRLPLVIDPELIFSTLSGSTADSWGNSACVDNGGNLYGVGTVFLRTISSGGVIDRDGFPTTVGAFQSVIAVDETSSQVNTFTDIGVMKFSPDGSQLLFATYIGGRECDVPTSSVVDDNGDLYILAVTSSNNLPNAFNTFSGGLPAVPGTYHTFPSGTDIAVIKLNQDGSNVLATRYMGGTQNDGLMEAYEGFPGSVRNPLVNNYGDQFRGDINVDNNGGVYVGSVTKSANFPIVNGVQPALNGYMDGVAFKLDSDLSSVVWSTYLGGASFDAIYSVFKDSEDNLFVSGGTFSVDFPTSADAINPNSLGGGDGFVARISMDGDSLLGATYLGTNQLDQAYFVQLDTSDNAYLLGQTKGQYSVDNADYFAENAGLFVHKLSPNLDSTFFSTTIGSSTSDPNRIVANISPTAFLVNECENMFISGWGGIQTNGNGGFLDYRFGQVFFPQYNRAIETSEVIYGETKDMYISSYAFKGEAETDNNDFYLFVLQKDAKAPLYGTYYGGGSGLDIVAEHVDGGTSRFDKAGIVYQAVCADCGGETTATNGFPVFPDDGDQNTYPKDNASGNCNNGLFKFDLANLDASFTHNTNCDTLLVNFQNTTLGGVDFEWIFGDGSDTLFTSNPTDVSHTYQEPGNYLVTLIATDLTTCVGKDTTILPVEVKEVLEPGVYDYTQCVGLPVSVQGGYTSSEYNYQWEPASAVESPNSPVTNVLVSTSDTFLLTVTNSFGCQIVDSVPVNLLIFNLDISHQIIGNCEGRVPETIFTHNGGDVTYTKWFLNGNQIGDLDTLKYVFENYGSYVIDAEIDSVGCIFNASETVVLNEVMVPNIFTPNNDGSNDTYVVDGIQGTGDWNLTVYNRWGKQIYESEAYDNSWNGGDLNAGTYYYLLTAPDETFCKGWVQIIR